MSLAAKVFPALAMVLASSSTLGQARASTFFLIPRSNKRRPTKSARPRWSTKSQSILRLYRAIQFHQFRGEQRRLCRAPSLGRTAIAGRELLDASSFRQCHNQSAAIWFIEAATGDVQFCAPRHPGVCLQLSLPE
jgi:hypothetical protein